jgi:hypothetical protein
MTLLLEQFLNKLAAGIGVGGPRVAAANHHAPNLPGCMEFMFLMDGGITHDSSLKSFQLSALARN